MSGNLERKNEMFDVKILDLLMLLADHLTSTLKKRKNSDVVK